MKDFHIIFILKRCQFADLTCEKYSSRENNKQLASKYIHS